MVIKMKYLKKINLIDTQNNINLKKVIDETYHQGKNYYQEIEKHQKDSKNN